MKVLIAIALLSVASALPRPDLSDIDFRPLIVPKEIIEAAQAMNDVQEQNSGIAVNFVDNAQESAVVAEDAGVKFVDNAENSETAVEDAGLKVNFVDNAELSVPADEDGLKVNFVDNAEESLPADENDGIKVNFVESPINEVADNSGIAVNFVDSPVEPVDSSVKELESTEGVIVHIVDTADDGVAVNFVDSAPEAVVDVADDTAVHFVDAPLNEIPQNSFLAINFVNLPLETNAGAVLIIGNVYEPISASELESVRVVDMPMPAEEIRFPGKIFENPLLR